MGDMVTPLDRRVPHPLEQLSIGECNTARDVILSTHGVSVIDFRTINLEEPPKSLLQPFLDLEAEGRIPKPDAYPPRLARVAYDVISENKVFEFYESVVELVTGAVKVKELIDASHQAPLVMDPDDEDKRYFQGLCFAQDKRSGNPDSNFYAYPLPLIPVMDARTKEIVRIDRLGTGGKQDGLAKGTHNKEIIKHCKGAEYVPELLENGSRKDLKPLDVIQPDGPSFTVTDESLVEWQKWRFRVGFNPREGATIHDVRYEGRSIVYRMAISEMYFDSVNVAADGTATEQPNIVCLHEQDNGIGWKHTNWRTGRAVVTRHRELVVQFIITLANYEYIFAYKFDQAGGIVVETRATGIVSVVNIDEGKTSMYGNVVSPGAMAQNHQHIFAVRVDPAIDGPNNTIVLEESHPVPTSSDRNPAGNLYEVRQTPIKESGGHDAAPEHNRIVRIMNPNKTNPISGKPVSYKFKPPPTQKLLAQPGSIQARRATFTQHHVWVTKYKDNELYAGGRYTLQSRDEVDGVADAAKRAENVENTDVVLWSSEKSE
ncbi:putative Copper amine oxidase 1 [Glarea lozoyensis 74030]|uniref:Amine oxidase n=1 Tax=Glarea lozoyensis (strain ATCC 74030 / MF5533) TaxID=1104152 RepID=H0EFZ2_GLAL7|nr:putative Copper amine oxidase 1 [Glarea lozoyensis 74030]